MTGLSASLAKLMRQRRDWYASLPGAETTRSVAAEDVPARLVAVNDFGSNPGRLAMFAYVPPSLPKGAPLVVVLHGCTQDAAGYDHGSGWSELAERHGFALLYAEQQRVNNPNLCFNWFRRGDTERGRGEPMSIRQMVRRMLRDHKLDARRVFITGLSAGGAMTAVMLATYPELFAAGAIIGGLPHGAAGNVQEAFTSMAGGISREPSAWGDLVRSASAHKGAWPRVSIWHGTEDATVRLANAHELVKQWTDVHGLGAAEPERDLGDGHERLIWAGGKGPLVELVTIAGMGHGVPIAAGQESGGEAGPYFLETGLASTRRIAAFFGLIPARAVVRARRVPRPEWRTMPRQATPEDKAPESAPANEVGTAIVRALKAAGLMR